MREMVGWDHCAGMPGYIDFAHGLGSRRAAGEAAVAQARLRVARAMRHEQRSVQCTVCVLVIESVF